jgi:hypothetical protein
MKSALPSECCDDCQWPLTGIGRGDRQKSQPERENGNMNRGISVPGGTKVVDSVSEEALQGIIGPLIGPRHFLATLDRALAC